MEEDEIDEGEAQFPCIHSDGNGQKILCKENANKFAAM